MKNPFYSYAAKAIVALVMPFVVAALAWVTEEFGWSPPVDLTWVEATLVSVLTAIPVYLKRNKPEFQVEQPVVVDIP